MKTPCIRRSLLFRCGIGVGTLLCVLFVAIYLLVRQSLIRELDQSITQTAALLANQMELENGAVTFEWQEGLGSNDALILKGLFQFWDDHTGETIRSPALGSRNLPRFHGPGGKPLLKNIAMPNGGRGRAIGLKVRPFILPEEMDNMRRKGEMVDPRSLPHTLVVAGDIEPIHRTLEHLRYALVSGALLTLALGFTLIDQVIRISLRPIDELTRQMLERSEHQLDSSLTLPGGLPAELTGLARNFDLLLSRVAIMRQRERDFIRHAAHELRTPIAGLHATAELALSRPRDSDAYANYLATCRKSAEELGAIVARLSALARLGINTTSPVILESLPVAEFLNEPLETFRPIFKSRHLDFVAAPVDPELRAIGDRTLSRIVINNLLDNAASYTPPGGLIEINCKRIGQHIRIVVSNPTLDLPENLSRLFEPSFRNEPALNDAGTHLGVGLALSLDAARAMGCDLEAHRTEEDRIEFVFILPAAIG